MKKNIQRILIDLLETDTDFSSLNERNIREKYLNISDAEKQTVDSIFINLTGFSLETLLFDSPRTECPRIHHGEESLYKDLLDPVLKDGDCANHSVQNEMIPSQMLHLSRCANQISTFEANI